MLSNPRTLSWLHPQCHDPTNFGVYSKDCHNFHCRSRCCCTSSLHACNHTLHCTCHQYSCNMISCRDCLRQCCFDELQQVWLSYGFSDQMSPPLSLVALLIDKVIMLWFPQHYWSVCTHQKESTIPSFLVCLWWFQLQSRKWLHLYYSSPQQWLELHGHGMQLIDQQRQ